MKLPWVSRAEYERLVADCEWQRRWFLGEREDNIAAQKAWSERYESLLSRFHMLKLQGFTEPPPAAAPVEPRTVDVCVQAINAKAGSNRALRAVMMQQLRQDRALGVDEAEILRAIEEGVPAFEQGVPG